MSNSSLPPLPPLSDFLCFALYSANHAMHRVYKPHLDALGLTYPQFLTMVVLWEQDGQSVRDIGARLGLESSTLTPLLKRLETAGLLRRDRDSQDERIVRIRLTSQGRALQDRTGDMARCLVEAVDMDAQAASTFVQQITALRDRLNEVLAEGRADQPNR